MSATIKTAVVVFCCFASAGAARGQGLPDLYRIAGGVSASHVEYHTVKIPRGKEVSLAERQGPGKVTYGQIPSGDDYTSVAFWYQEEPHQAFTLPAFAERVAPSRAVEY